MDKQTLSDVYVRDYYDSYVGDLSVPYTQQRWFSSVVGRFDYGQTLRSLRRAFSLVGEVSGQTLEVGPGDGVWTREILNHCKGELVLLDQSREMLSRAKTALADERRISYVLSDFIEYTQDTRYECAVLMRCFEYFEDKPAAMRKLHSLLVPGGRAIVVTKNPCYVSFRGKTEKLLHADQIGKKEFIELARTHGFTVVAAYPATYRWMARSAFMRVLFAVLHWSAVATRGRIVIPFLESRASESYLYVLRT